jgi:hypothetical protein
MDKQDQAFNRLLKKLSALRATLKGDERNLLDGLIIGPNDEVAAHSMRVTPISPTRSSTRASSPDEVRASAMKVSSTRSSTRASTPDEVKASTMKVSSTRSSTRASTPDEVRASAMKVSSTRSSTRASSPDEVRANAMTVRIIYDQTKNEYQRSS